MKPKHPIYIISKGRWDRRPTSRVLEEMGVPYLMVVEQQEYENYAKHINPAKLLILPQKYIDDYDTFWDKKSDPRYGAGVARNFCWQHSIDNGHKWHWVLDDNIESVERFNYNKKIKCNTATPFYVVEEFVSRYENIALAGIGYAIFCPASEARPPIRFNTRIYSCLLIRNDINYRWRGRYNEDTDLSLRVLKDGWVTVEFNAFLIGKRATQTVKGGNTAEFYKQEGTTNKSQMLVDMHPDVTKLVTRFNRVHHLVDYKPFKGNLLIKKQGLVIDSKPNEFGMVLKLRNKL